MIRHGLVHNPDHVAYGCLPGFHLGETGREEARAAGRFMADVPFETVWHSPLERAVETGEAVHAGHACPFVRQDLLLEWDGIEAMEPAIARIRAFWEFWRQAPEQLAVAVSHRDPIRFLLLDLAGRDPAANIADLTQFPLDTAGIYRIDGVDTPRITHVFAAQPPTHR